MSRKRQKTSMTRSERLCRTLLILLMCMASVWGVWHLVVHKPAVASDAPPVPAKPAFSAAAKRAR